MTLRAAFRDASRRRLLPFPRPPAYPLSVRRLLTDNIEGSKWFGNGSALGFSPKVIWYPTWCFAVAGILTLSSVSLIDNATCSSTDEKTKENTSSQKHRRRKPKVVFVLGGPGSGKGTQCAKIVDRYGFTHLSAGDLLRAEIKSGSPYGTMIEKTIKEGKIVPSEVTIKLLQKAMQDSGNEKFLIDGFPRNEENRAAFETVTGIEPQFVIYFDCSEEVMEKRLLSRNQGRVDDNIDTIKKRFRVFIESSLPVIRHYENRGKVRTINANRDIEEVFHSLRPFFTPMIEEDLLTLTEDLLQCIDSGEYDAYEKNCDSGLTSFQPEAEGHLVEGLGFHKVCLDLVKRKVESGNALHSQILSPKITLLGNNDAALVTYTRLCQISTGNGNSSVNTSNETQIWQCKRDPTGILAWKLRHFHRSNCRSS